MFSKMRQVLQTACSGISRRFVIVPVVMAITALCLCMSAFSVETYVITDGDETIVHKSYDKDPRLAVINAGKELSELDDIVIEEQQNGNIKITVMRAGEVSIVADGAQHAVNVRYDDTVEEAIARAGIAVGELDEVTPAKDDTVVYGSTVTVERIEVAQASKTIEIPFESVTKKNGSMQLGTSKVLQKGQNGSKEQTVEIKKRDGVVVSETVLSETVLKAPVNKIVEKGTKVSANVVAGAGSIATSRNGTLRYTKVLDVTATAYSSELISNKLTATGAVARVGLIAVDPRVIPLGTRMYITSLDGTSWVYGYAVAADTGGAIKGNKIDLFFNTERECINFGRRKARVYILE